MASGHSFTSSSPQNPGSMEGTQTLNRNNGVLQPQAKGSESGTGSPELLNPQVRSLPPPDCMQKKPSFHDFLFHARHSLLHPGHPHPHPSFPTARDFQVRVSSTCFSNLPAPGFTLPQPMHLPAQPLRPAFSHAAPSASATGPGRPSCKSPIFAILPAPAPNSCPSRNIFLFLSVLWVFCLSSLPGNFKGPHSWETPWRNPKGL